MKTQYLLWPCLSFLFLACVHKSKSVSQDQAGPSDQQCFRWAALGQVDSLQTNWHQCQKTNSPLATTLMMLAAARGRVEVLDFLWSQKQDPNERDLSGDTALYYAVGTDQAQSIAWLLQHGALNKSYRADGITPLMIAISNCRRETVLEFLKYPIEVDATMEDGWTSLFFAVRRQDLIITEALLNLAANPLLLSKEHESALDLAREQNWVEGIRLLKKKPKLLKKAGSP